MPLPCDGAAALERRGAPADADAELAEKEFVASMDAMQEYMQLQVKLQEQLKEGLLSLTRAKYSMGGRPLGQAQYDSDMRAATRCRVSQEPPSSNNSGGGSRGDDGDSAPSCSGRRTFHVHRVMVAQKAAPEAVTAAVDGKAGAQSRNGGGSSAAAALTAGHVELEGEEGDEYFEDEDDEEWEEEAELREAHDFLRRLRLQAEGESTGYGAGADASSSAGGGASSSGGGGSGKAGARGASSSRQRRRRGGAASDPLQWFGVLVPPTLKEAQGHFAAVVETCLQLTSTAQRFGPAR